ncbi:MAG: SOS response-associated peptidase [Clostridia bacterium]
MCGRYYIAEEDQAEELRRIIDEAQRRSTEAVKTGEIRPTDLAAVVANNRNGDKASFAMRWGYKLPKGLLINARSEAAGDKPLFRDGMERRRCLVPASWYFEWEKRGKEKIKYAISPEGMSLTYLAGIYRVVSGVASFVILTREAAPGIAFIHDRMPAILPKEMCHEWLDMRNDPREILAACEERMTYRTA